MKLLFFFPILLISSHLSCKIIERKKNKKSKCNRTFSEHYFSKCHLPLILHQRAGNRLGNPTAAQWNLTEVIKTFPKVKCVEFDWHAAPCRRVMFWLLWVLVYVVFVSFSQKSTDRHTLCVCVAFILVYANAHYLKTCPLELFIYGVCCVLKKVTVLENPD